MPMSVLVLLVAAGAAWESRALRLLGERPGIVVLKRCVDVDDMLAAASAGQADVAVLGVDAPGLDVAAVEHLRGHGVRPVAVVPGGAALDAAALRATRVGIRSLVAEDELDQLPDAVAAGEEPDETVVRGASSWAPADPGDPDAPTPGGRVVAVWGPAGAPGRTTLATALASELARRRLPTVVVDADPYGGAVAQQLGVLDEVSGLLSAARLSAGGMLAERWSSVQRAVAQDLTVVTGLPRADRWSEVRGGVVEHLLEIAREHAQVVVDTGFSLEQDLGETGSRPGRNAMTLGALEVADEVVVVGTADPVGLSRLARGLVDLRELRGAAPVRVVVNRMRPTLGWSERDVAAMVEGFTRVSGMHFLPDDRAVLDKALITGKALAETGDSALARAVAAVADGLVPETAVADGRVRRRRAGRARPR